MDRRPKLSKLFAELAFETLKAGQSVDEAAELILKHFTSDSIPLPDGKWVSSSDQGACQKFLAKYPELQPLIDLYTAEALKRWPNASSSFELNSDPEGCHVCSEGQHIYLAIDTGLDFYGPTGTHPKGSPFAGAKDEWEDWEVEDVDLEALKEKLGPMSHLLMTDLRWNQR